MDKDLQIKFVPTDEGYLIELPEQTLSVVLNTVRMFTLNADNRIAIPLTIDLENRLITRLVISNFMLDDSIAGYKENTFTKIRVKLPDREFVISTALIQTAPEEHEIVYGILYEN